MEEKRINNATASKKQSNDAIAAHDSNPFTTTITGIKKLLKYNKNTFIGVVFFNLLLSTLLFLAIMACLAGLIAFMAQSNAGWGALISSPLPSEVINYAKTMPVSAIYITWGLGLVLAILFGGLMQTVQLKLAAVSVTNQAIGFGSLFKQSMQRFLPFIGLGALLTLAIVVASAILTAIALLVGPIIFVVAPIVIIFALYLSFRLTFSGFSIVEEKLGPIAALKHSLGLTKGHFAEVVGIAAATTVFVLLPTIFFDLLSTAGGPAAAVFQIISFVVSLVVGIIAMMGFAQRYLQLRNIKSGSVAPTKTHVSNYLAVAVCIICLFISAALTPQEYAVDQSGTDPSVDSAELQQKLNELEQQQYNYN